MRRFLRNIAVVAVVVLTMTGCFKKVTTDTTLRVKTLLQEVSGGDLLPAEGTFAYIYYTDSEEWVIESYADAVAKTITNPATGEKRSEPDGESEPYRIEGSDNNYLSIFQDKAPALLVVVEPVSKMYGYMYRKAEAENLTYTYLTIIFRPWKQDNYSEGSKEGYKWNVVVTEKEESNE